VLALAVRWVLDQGPTIALWGARRPDQLGPIAEIDGWHIDDDSKRAIDAILKRCIKDPVSPDFMAAVYAGGGARDGHDLTHRARRRGSAISVLASKSTLPGLHRHLMQEAARSGNAC
jgi:hypothetical protein